MIIRTQELCESRGGRLGPNNPHGLCGRKTTWNLQGAELRSCVKAEVAVQGRPDP